MYDPIVCQRASARGREATGLEPLELAALGWEQSRPALLGSSLPFLVVLPCVVAVRLMHGSGTCRARRFQRACTAGGVGVGDRANGGLHRYDLIDLPVPPISAAEPL